MDFAAAGCCGLLLVELRVYSGGLRGGLRSCGLLWVEQRVYSGGLRSCGLLWAVAGDLRCCGLFKLNHSVKARVAC